MNTIANGGLFMREFIMNISHKSKLFPYESLQLL